MGGRFENKKTERNLPWGRIIFSSREHITVETEYTTVIFHRFFAPKGHYSQCWKPFRQEITRRRLDSIYDVYRYAERYEITYFTKTSNGTGKPKTKEDK